MRDVGRPVVSAQDPGAATGQQPYEPDRCECGDLEPVHAFDTNGRRKACSSSLCGCRRFVAAEAVSR